jgi:hypothetical protein
LLAVVKQASRLLSRDRNALKPRHKSTPGVNTKGRNIPAATKSGLY